MSSDPYVSSIAELEQVYGQPGAASLRKVAGHMTPLYRKWILQSRFCILSTVGPEGTDGSPRGDDGPIVVEQDPQTLLMPDWHGNNRIDSLRNIVVDGRVSLMFMVGGSNTVVRVNGTAKVSLSAELQQRFEHKGKLPRSVVVIRIDEIYTQCARALMRAGLWAQNAPSDLPTPGDIIDEMTQGEIDGKAYDAAWPGRAETTMW